VVIEEAGGERAGLSTEFLSEVIRQDAQAAYDRREEELTPEVTRELERRVVLSVLDRKWREHLYEMDYLRDGIGLRAWAQRDPLVEYQREGFDMFGEMMAGIKEESVGSLFNLQVQMQEGPIVEEAAPDAPPLAAGPGNGRTQIAPGGQAAGGAQPGRSQPARSQSGRSQSGRSQPGRSRPGRAASRQAPGSQQPPDASEGKPIPAGLAPRGLAQPQRPGRLEYSAPSEDGTGTAERRAGSPGSAAGGRVGRNDLCPCGSGRKYKRCHGDPRTRQGA